MALKESKALEKWLSLEYRKLNQNLVARQLYLKDLLQMVEPTALTKTDDK